MLMLGLVSKKSIVPWRSPRALMHRSVSGNTAACNASASSFQTKVLIETLERMCNRLVYDPRKSTMMPAISYLNELNCETEHETELDNVWQADDDYDPLLLAQAFFIIGVGIALCILNKKDRNGD